MLGMLLLDGQPGCGGRPLSALTAPQRCLALFHSAMVCPRFLLQAEGRAHRLGQESTVMVYQLFTKASSSSREPGMHKHSNPQPACSIAAAWFDRGRRACSTPTAWEPILWPQGAMHWRSIWPSALEPALPALPICRRTVWRSASCSWLPGGHGLGTIAQAWPGLRHHQLLAVGCGAPSSWGPALWAHQRHF